MASGAIGGRLRQFWNSPVGPKTTQFWGPIANWGFVISGLIDWEKPAEKVSGPMTTAMCIYSALFMRFSLRVQPKNYLLFACHLSNEAVQLYHLQRKIRYEQNKKAGTLQTPVGPAAVFGSKSSPAAAAAATPASASPAIAIPSSSSPSTSAATPTAAAAAAPAAKA